MTRGHLQGGPLTNHQHPERTRRLSVKPLLLTNGVTLLYSLFVFMSADRAGASTAQCYYSSSRFRVVVAFLLCLYLFLLE